MDKQILNTTKDRVRAILEISVNSRNSDASLVANYLVTYEKHLLDGIEGDITLNATLPLYRYKDITPPSVIERMRRKIQEECNLMPDMTEQDKKLKLEAMSKYYPTEEKVLKIRRLNSRLWKEYMNEQKINLVMVQD